MYKMGHIPRAVSFLQVIKGCVNNWKSVNGIHPIHNKEESHTINLNDLEEKIRQNLVTIHEETLDKLPIEGNFVIWELSP